MGLKRCPFCLNDNAEVVDFGNDDGEIEYAACCTNCGATGPNDISVELASEMWNLRRIEHPEEIKLIQFFELRKRQPERGIIEVWDQVCNTPA